MKKNVGWENRYMNKGKVAIFLERKFAKYLFNSNFKYFIR